jgi:imidazolonepropionase-like amidohydrolase
VIDAGARADLVLLADNPLDKLEALRKPLGVMIAGQWHASEEIAAVLEQNRRSIAAQMQDVISAAAP